jgi:hypothetical protein
MLIILDNVRSLGCSEDNCPLNMFGAAAHIVCCFLYPRSYTSFKNTASYHKMARVSRIHGKEMHTEF